MPTPLTVKISGPGQTFDLELHYIKRLLEDMGWTIEEKNEYPAELTDEQADDLQKRRSNRTSNLNGIATVVAIHCPWGG